MFSSHPACYKEWKVLRLDKLFFYFAGEMSNFMEVNTKFLSLLTANITQPTKPIDVNYTGAVGKRNLK